MYGINGNVYFYIYFQVNDCCSFTSSQFTLKTNRGECIILMRAISVQNSNACFIRSVVQKHRQSLLSVSCQFREHGNTQSIENPACLGLHTKPTVGTGKGPFYCFIPYAR